VEIRDAVALIADAVPERGGVWADLGAGEGTFTRALVELLGADATIYAVDSDRAAIAALTRWSRTARNVVPVAGDFTRPRALAELAESPLDGILLANALHFVPDAKRVLTDLVRLLRPGGRVVFVEYDRRARSRWVPYPISPAQLNELAAATGLSPPKVTSRTNSAFGGELYAAVSQREDATPGA
jgi:ubiquinone/menaquinone biosynthesis C-methylase UbiE